MKFFNISENLRQNQSKGRTYFKDRPFPNNFHKNLPSQLLEHISHFVLVFFTVNFEHVNVSDQ